MVEESSVAARKAFFEKRRFGKEESCSAGELEMVNLGPPPRVPTPPPRPLGDLRPIVKTNKDFLTGPLF